MILIIVLYSLFTRLPLTIHLSNLSFYSYHGLYEEENLVGGKYIVNVDITIQTPAEPIQQLEQTVNYVEAYDLIKARMQQPTSLLETIAMELADQLIHLSDLIENVVINIQKFSLPIEGFQGNTGVTFRKSR